MDYYQFPSIKDPHWAVVKDKKRNSGLTSCRFLSNDLIVACDFNEHKTYLADIKNHRLNIIDSAPTQIASGQSVETDLMDLKGNLFIVSNFYQGSVSLYKIENDKIVFQAEMDLSPAFTNMHGVRFIPGYESLIWVSYCGVNNKCHQIWDISKKVVIHHFDTDEQCQDIAFMNEYAVVFARTDHIWVKSKPSLWSKKRRMYATAYVYRLPANLYDGKPVRVSEWRGKGHLDAVKEYDGALYAANQYLNKVDVFEVTASGRLVLKEELHGFGMPHGLDIFEGKLAVTNYEDQSLRVLEIGS